MKHKGFNKNILWDKLDIEIRNAKIVTTWDVLKRWTKLGYKEKIQILMKEYFLSYSRIEIIRMVIIIICSSNA